MHPYFAEQHARLHRLDLSRAAEAAMDHPERAGPRTPPHRAATMATGRLLVRIGGHLAAGRRPSPAPCPWCDGAFPAHRCQVDAGAGAGAGARQPVVAGLSPRC